MLCLCGDKCQPVLIFAWVFLLNRKVSTSSPQTDVLWFTVTTKLFLLSCWKQHIWSRDDGLHTCNMWFSNWGTHNFGVTFYSVAHSKITQHTFRAKYTISIAHLYFIQRKVMLCKAKMLLTTLPGCRCFHCLPKNWCSFLKEEKSGCHLTNNSRLDDGCLGAANWSWTHSRKLCFQRERREKNSAEQAVFSLVALTRGLSLAVDLQERWIATLCRSFLPLRLIFVSGRWSWAFAWFDWEKWIPNYRSCFVPASVLELFLVGLSHRRWRIRRGSSTSPEPRPRPSQPGVMAWPRMRYLL